jgi:hypothetical protein
MKNEFTTHNYEYNCNDGTVTDVYGDKMSGVDDFIDEMNMLIQEIRRLKKENDKSLKLEDVERLERERNEAREEAEWARGLIDGWSEASVTKFPWEN